MKCMRITFDLRLFPESIYYIIDLSYTLIFRIAASRTATDDVTN